MMCFLLFVPDTFDIVNLSPSSLYTFRVSVANDRGVGDPFVLSHRTPDVEGRGRCERASHYMTICINLTCIFAFDSLVLVRFIRYNFHNTPKLEFYTKLIVGLYFILIF